MKDNSVATARSILTGLLLNLGGDAAYDALKYLWKSRHENDDYDDLRIKIVRTLDNHRDVLLEIVHHLI